MSKELALTKESIANEGIEIKVTQSDVIDALVEEQLNGITSIYETLVENHKNIMELIEKEWSDFKNKLVAKQKTPRGLTFGTAKTNGSTSSYFTLYGVNEYHDSRSAGTVKYSSNTRNISLKADGKLYIVYEVQIHGIDFQGESEPIPYKFSHSKKLVELMEQHNAKVKEFMDMVPAKGINEKEIARKIKNQFTKEILKSSSPEFRAKLKDGFGLTL